METCTSMIDSLTEIKPSMDMEVDQNAEEQQITRLPLRGRTNIASSRPNEGQKTNSNREQLQLTRINQGELQRSMIDTSKIKTEVMDAFDIDSMVDTINRNPESEQERNNMLSENNYNIELLIETIHKSDKTSETTVVKSEPNENGQNSTSSIDDIEALVEIFSRKPDQVKPPQSSNSVKPTRSIVGLRLTDEKENKNKQLVDNSVKNCSVVLDYQLSVGSDINIDDKITPKRKTTDVLDSSGDRNAKNKQSSSIQKTGPRQKVQKSVTFSHYKKEDVDKPDQNKSKDVTQEQKSAEQKKSKFVFDPVTKTLKLNLNRAEPQKSSVPNNDKKDSTANLPKNVESPDISAKSEKHRQSMTKDTVRNIESGKRKAGDGIVGDEQTHKKPRKTAEENERIVSKKIDQNKEKKSHIDDSQSTENNPDNSGDNIRKFRFTCKICGMGFIKTQTFATHMKTHKMTVTSFRCQICEKKFDKSSELEEHVKVHNRRIVKTLKLESSSSYGKNKKSLKSKPTSDQLDKKEENKHNLNDRQTRQTKTVKSEIKDAVKCKICGKGIQSVEKLEIHMNTIHRDIQDQGKFRCEICSETFTTARKLSGHAASHKEVKKNKNESKEERKTKNDKDGKQKDKSLENSEEVTKKKEEAKTEGKNELKSFPCKTCNRSFSKSSELVEHVQTQHIKKCSVCKESFGSVRELVSHMKIHEDLRCSFCDEYFNSKKDLEHHMKSHTKHQKENKSGTSSTKPSSNDTMETDQLEFTCSKCFDVLPSEKDFNDHMKAHGKVPDYEQFAGKSIFPCQKCSGLFTEKEDLLMHIRIHAEKSTCKICLKEYPSEAELKEHEKIHSNPDSLKCTICFLTFTTPTEMEEHKETHKGEARHKCDICFKRFGKIKELEEHSEKTHNIFNKKCKTCDKTFLSSSEYNSHAKTNCKTNHKTQEIVCEICNRKFDTRWELSRHMKSHVKKNEIECKICLLKFDNMKELTEHKNIHLQVLCDCKICFKKFKAQSILNEHMKVHYGKNCQQCRLCGKCFPSEREYQDHEKIAHPDQWVKCDICQETFKSLVTLTDHMTKHQTQKIDCTECGKSFSTKKHLSSHWKSEHIKGMNFMCGICKIPFRTEKNLTTHVSDCHDKVEYKCGMCDKMFPSEKKLTDHMQTHEAKFQCGVCQNEFISETSLMDHLQAHAIPSTEIVPEFPCDECNKKFTTSDELEKHISDCHMMDVFQCGYCQCFFSSNETLVQHIVTHMASPAYTCDICGEVFKSKADFDKHQHSTVKERKFVCGICTFVGKNRSQLMGHLKKHL